MALISSYETNNLIDMGRRHRRLIRPIRKSLPKVFSCPRCGVPSIRISNSDNTTSTTENASTTVVCGSCGLNHEAPTSIKQEPVDIYNRFVDEYMAGKMGT